MKIKILVVLIICLATLNCRETEKIHLFQVEFKPVGMDDSFRVTLVTAMNTDYFPPKHITIKTHVTDSVSLERLVTFVRRKHTSEDPNQPKFSQYGCYRISLFKQGNLITAYYLDKVQSIQYFKELIEILSQDKLDAQLTNSVKDFILRRIDAM